MGGYEDVQAANAWTKVAEVMGHDAGWGPQIALAYKRIVYPFDTLSIRAKTASLSPLTPLPASKAQKPPGWTAATPDSPSNSGRTGMAPGRMGMVQRRRPDPAPSTLLNTVPLTFGPEIATSPRSSQPPDSAALSSKVRIPGFSTKSRAESESDLSDDDSLTPPPPDHKSEYYQKGEVCEVCRKGNFAEKILLCDGCDRGESSI
jgi:histone demethylase JARID1